MSFYIRFSLEKIKTFLFSSFLLLTFTTFFCVVVSTEIECIFPFPYNIYGCELENISLTDNSSQEITIIRNHNNRNDDDVRSIRITNSNIPFIITQLFPIFQNVFRITIDSSGLTRIQSNAFSEAKKLELIFIVGNPLHTIQADAFLGASKLVNLDLRLNRLRNIHSDAFRGQESLLHLMLEVNQIRRLPSNVFDSLTNVEAIVLADNYIEVIEGKIFAKNQRLRYIDFARNRINEVQNTVLSGLEDLQLFNVFSNQCVDNFFVVDDVTSIDDIEKELTDCFTNFSAVGRLRVEVRGTMTISDDYGNKMFNV